MQKSEKMVSYKHDRDKVQRDVREVPKGPDHRGRLVRLLHGGSYHQPDLVGRHWPFAVDVKKAKIKVDFS